MTYRAKVIPMGGCYDTTYSTRSHEPAWKTTTKSSTAAFFRSGETPDLVAAYKAYGESNSSGFIKALLDHKDCKEAPKEFPDIEYEIKFNIDVYKSDRNGNEPGMQQFLQAFDFPATRAARFLKDDVDVVAQGTNHFFGEGIEERLVVIEKGGKIYLKEKSQPLELKTGVQYEQIVIKRTEKRYEAKLDKILQKVAEVAKGGASYIGAAVKDKGDAFVLDTQSGRIFSFTVTKAHRDHLVQRQLEIEYAGYVPGFPQFEKGSEKQIVSDMVALAKQVAFLNNDVAIAPGWSVRLELTDERKYDFVSQIPGKKLSLPNRTLVKA
jgi:hypothetical protein